MKQEGSARRRGADKAKPPPGGGEPEPPPPPAPQDVEMKEEAAAGSGAPAEADGKAAAVAEHSQRELDTVTLEGREPGAELAAIAGDSDRGRRLLPGPRRSAPARLPRASPWAGSSVFAPARDTWPQPRERSRSPPALAG